MAISEIVDVSITETETGTTLESFDIIGILAAAADTTPASYSSVRAKVYDANTSGLAAIADDWTDSSVAYEMAAQIVAQEVHPDQIVIMKRGAAVATVKTVTFSGNLASGHSVSGVVNGTAFGPIAFSVDESTTLGLIDDAITAIEGVGGVTTDAGTNTVVITASSEWDLDVSITTAGTAAPTAAITVTTAGRNAADDLADAIAEDDTNIWYGLVTGDTNKGLQLATAAYIETTEKYYWLRTSESASKTAGGADALAIRLSDENYRRTLGFWHHDLTEYIDAAAMGLYLGNSPGSIQLFGRELTGVTVTPTSSLDSTGVTVLEGRFFNTYRQFGAYGMVKKGVRVDGVVAEATRDLDYARNELRAAFLVYLSQTMKPPYDKDGLKSIEMVGQGVMQRMVSEGIFRGDLPATFEVPALSAISSTDQSNRLVPNCLAKATLLKGVIQVEIPMQIAI